MAYLMMHIFMIGPWFLEIIWKFLICATATATPILRVTRKLTQKKKKSNAHQHKKSTIVNIQTYRNINNIFYFSEGWKPNSSDKHTEQIYVSELFYFLCYDFSIYHLPKQFFYALPKGVYSKSFNLTFMVKNFPKILQTRNQILQHSIIICACIGNTSCNIYQFSYLHNTFEKSRS